MFVFEIISIILGILNTFASVFTLFLLKCSPRFNSYNTLIKYMTYCQFIFDFLATMDQILSYGFKIKTVSIQAYVIPFQIIMFFVGLASGLFALVIVWLLFYIVYYRSYIDVTHFQKRLLSFVFIPCCVICVAVGIVIIGWGYASIEYEFIYDVYQFARLSIILLIIAMISIIFYTLSITKGYYSDNESNPVYVLAKKLIIYPIVQFISRVPFFFMNTYPNVDWLIHLSYLTAPCGGIGNMIAFIIANSYCKDVIYGLILCKSIVISDEPLNGEIKIKETRSRLNSHYSTNSTDSESYFVNNNIDGRLLSIEDFDLPYEQRKSYNNHINYDNFDEEQLTRHIAVLSNYKSNGI
jgi:hypothetical protein